MASTVATTAINRMIRGIVMLVGGLVGGFVTWVVYVLMVATVELMGATVVNGIIEVLVTVVTASGG
jgi:hypothetical protein